MKGNKGSRWYAPVTVIIGGSIIALAVGIGHGSSKALITQIITLVLGIGYFLLTRSNSDVGTIYGGRADERQHLVYLRASATSLRVMLGAAFVCAVITVALNDNYWQSDVIGSVGGVAFLVCLAAYGDDDDDRAHDPEEAMRDETVRKADESRWEHDE
jgi:ABC-type arginine/histidine transport system permease subunit